MSRLPLRFLFKILLVTLVAAGLLTTCLAAWIFWRLPDVSGLKNSRATLSIEVPDWKGRLHPFLLGPKNPDWVPLADLPADLKWAVIVAEDGNFYEHKGVDIPALKEALKYDLQQKRLARGASTITQQVAKNVLLSREKTLRRKLRELVVAMRMEKELSKGRILELYLNVVELGPMVYGAGQGARHYFDKSAADLSAAECAFLAAILPGPRVAFNPERRPKKVRQRAAHILKLLYLRGVLSEEQFSQSVLELSHLNEPPEEEPAVSTGPEPQEATPEVVPGQPEPPQTPETLEAPSPPEEEGAVNEHPLDQTDENSGPEVQQQIEQGQGPEGQDDPQPH